MSSKINRAYRTGVCRGWLAQQSSAAAAPRRGPRALPAPRPRSRAAAAAGRCSASCTSDLRKSGSSALKRSWALLAMVSSVACLNSHCAHYLVSVSQKHLLKQVSFQAGSYGELLSTCAKGFERAVVNSKNDVKMYTTGSRLSCVLIN